MLILQRYVAETRGAAIALVAIWVALVGVAVLVVLVRRRPGPAACAGGHLAGVLAGTLAVGYWTGFRDSEVMEDVAMASARASGRSAIAALSGDGGLRSGLASRRGGTGGAGERLGSRAPTVTPGPARRPWSSSRAASGC